VGAQRWQRRQMESGKWLCGVVAKTGYIYSRQAFGDCQLHVEFAEPLPPKAQTRSAGNSGVFLMGLYEIQVLDSFENKTYADGQAAAVYGQYPPLVNASRPPGKWQSYDIVFHGPRFDASGKLLRPARVTVFHNGVLAQDNVMLTGPTETWGASAVQANTRKIAAGASGSRRPGTLSQYLDSRIEIGGRREVERIFLGGSVARRNAARLAPESCRQQVLVFSKISPGPLVAQDELRFAWRRLVLQRIHGLQHQPVIARREILQMHHQPKRNHGIALLDVLLHGLNSGEQNLFVRGFSMIR